MIFKKLLLGLGGLIIILCVVAGAKFFIDIQSPPLGALQIDSIPEMEINFNGTVVGKTPYTQEQIKPGEYRIKVGDWENKVKIMPGSLTYVSREEAAGQILTMEKLPTERSSEMAIVSDPDGATISIDGLEKGRASIVLRDVGFGDKVVIISQSGYADQVIRARLAVGYRLNAIVKLRKLAFEPDRQIKSTAELVATSSAQIATISATIKENPLGFVRVRSNPDFIYDEIGKVYPGETYPVLMQNDAWAKIKMKDKEGWVSKDYLLII